MPTKKKVSTRVRVEKLAINIEGVGLVNFDGGGVDWEDGPYAGSSPDDIITAMQQIKRVQSLIEVG